MIKSILLLSFIICSSAFSQEHDETLVQAPKFESNEHSLYGMGCRTRDHLTWDVCYDIDVNNIYTMRSFRFANTGENRTVPSGGFNVSREFTFSFEGLARSDMGLMVWDSPSEIESHGHLKILFFFPRHVMPAIRYESDADKDIMIVTLPTREEVIFSTKTREIINGALTEGPMKQTSSGSAVSPDVQYNGAGVVIEASALADWPVGLGPNAAKVVSVKKKGHKTCLVPQKDLWYTDHNKGGNVFFNKKLISNEAIDKYIQARCGFSIY